MKFLISYFAVGFVAFFGSLTLSLRCHQGVMNNTFKVTGSPTECLGTAYSCLKSVDLTSKIATRNCQYTNCTENGYQTFTPKCTSNGLQEICCCYGDGCNPSSRTAFNIFLITLSIIVAISFFNIIY
uniref:Activin_recp domain-containing protein n=1 Tax=Strongyloides venezuelensis TaxID=75913 RepID=A0A0K0EWK0_STRVS